MSTGQLFVVNLLAVLILSFGLYLPRYQRRDMVVALLGINIGVMAVATALTNAEVTAGVGLGLFGVLSIIRIRSEELTQVEVVFYFAAIAMGVLGGIPIDPSWFSPALMCALLVALYVGDHPVLFRGLGRHRIVVNQAYTNHQELVDRLSMELEAKITRVEVKRIDQVKDTTTVDVRYRRG